MISYTTLILSGVVTMISPPWFRVELPNPTTDNIEVRICNTQGTFDDVAVQLLETYINVMNQM